MRIAWYTAIPALGALGIISCVVSEPTDGTSESSTGQVHQALNTDAGSGDLPVVGAVDVSASANIGSGTWSDPYRCWDTAITWKNATTYIFKPGVYAYPAQSGCSVTSTAAPNWGLPGIRLYGQNSVVLKYTGSAGDAVRFDGSASRTGAYDVVFENFTVAGSASVSGLNGVRARALLRSVFRNIRIADISGTALLLEGAHLNTFSDVRISSNLSPGWAYNTPSTGIKLDRFVGTLDGVESTLDANANTFVGVIVEGVSNTGIELRYAHGNVFSGGASESNVVGMHIDANSGSNSVSGMWFEGNDGNNSADLRVFGFFNTFISLISLSGVHVASTTSPLSYGYQNAFYGGQFNSITIDANVWGTILDGVTYGEGSPGTLTDNGTDTYKRMVYHWPIGHDVDTAPTGFGFLKVVGPSAGYQSDVGNIQIANSNDTTKRLFLGYDSSLGTYGSGYLQAAKSGTTTVPLLLNPAAGSVGVNTDSPTAELEVNGGVRINTTKSQPTCDATVRGTFWATQGAPGVKDTVQVCAKDASDAYAWRVVY